MQAPAAPALDLWQITSSFPSLVYCWIKHFKRFKNTTCWSGTIIIFLAQPMEPSRNLGRYHGGNILSCSAGVTLTYNLDCKSKVEWLGIKGGWFNTQYLSIYIYYAYLVCMYLYIILILSIFIMYVSTYDTGNGCRWSQVTSCWCTHSRSCGPRCFAGGRSSALLNEQPYGDSSRARKCPTLMWDSGQMANWVLSKTLVNARQTCVAAVYYSWWSQLHTGGKRKVKKIWWKDAITALHHQQVNSPMALSLCRTCKPAKSSFCQCYGHEGR